jgi:hypothetical protein
LGAGILVHRPGAMGDRLGVPLDLRIHRAESKLRAVDEGIPGPLQGEFAVADRTLRRVDYSVSGK